MPPVIRSNVVATLAEFGDFESFDGGELDIQTTDWFPPGANTPVKLQGPHTLTDVTLTRVYDPPRDEALFDWFSLAARGMVTPRTLTVLYKNQMGIVQRERTFPVVMPKNIVAPGGKSGDGAPTELRVVLSVQGMN